MVLHTLLLAHVSSIAGVTHWKLEDNSIMPLEASHSPGSGKIGDVFAVNLADSDPEFAILIRHTTKMNSGVGVGNRKPRPIVTATVDGHKGGGGTRSHCPVLTVDLSSDGELIFKNSYIYIYISSGVTSSVKERRKGLCSRESVSVCAGGDCREGGQRRPRNPDGSGPMYVE